MNKNRLRVLFGFIGLLAVLGALFTFSNLFNSASYNASEMQCLNQEAQNFTNGVYCLSALADQQHAGQTIFWFSTITAIVMGVLYWLMGNDLVDTV